MLSFSENLSLVSTQAADTCEQVQYVISHIAKFKWERTLLEAVQKLACKVCCKGWNMDYESMLGHLNIPTLQQRRLQLKASMMYAQWELYAWRCSTPSSPLQLWHT